MLVDASTDSGMLDQSENDMVDAIFDLRQVLVRQVMIPRTEMQAIPADATLRDLLDRQEGEAHGKYPIYEDDIDRIVGIVYVRDVILELAKGNLDGPIRPYIRKVTYLPETSRINGALGVFRSARQHVAIVLDEYGGTAGMITLEDIVEEIAGELPDQFDTDDPEIMPLEGGGWEVSGLVTIEDLNEALHLELHDEHYDTIGGYVMGLLERIPKAGDEVKERGIRFAVAKVDGKRIDRLHIFVER
jgi:putative hemolysin